MRDIFKTPGIKKTKIPMHSTHLHTPGTKRNEQTENMCRSARVQYNIRSLGCNLRSDAKSVRRPDHT